MFIIPEVFPRFIADEYCSAASLTQSVWSRAEIVALDDESRDGPINYSGAD
jgi:hypothetical protein